jgi:hypothetical protein
MWLGGAAGAAFQAQGIGERFKELLSQRIRLPFVKRGVYNLPYNPLV